MLTNLPICFIPMTRPPAEELHITELGFQFSMGALAFDMVNVQFLTIVGSPTAAGTVITVPDY